MGSVGAVRHLKAEGGGEDQVKRRERFSQRHPDVCFSVSPLTRLLRAEYTDPASGDRKTTAGHFWLAHLLDFLERILDL